MFHEDVVEYEASDYFDMSNVDKAIKASSMTDVDQGINPSSMSDVDLSEAGLQGTKIYISLFAFMTYENMGL